ncbi:Transcriptional regulator HilA [Luteitalea pratensis]|uniref:Transcriptional regulator HilA n=1 Tax=Luteitalea pratensis TaxID=1855912 RepID=A0A143PE81_LUTPR|nr:winged helix-turn-helix domain-containing protein [Luteitalea pratensis]AMY06882.1 Transcriptional regulator HilA [Luteitalea pratensis]
MAETEVRGAYQFGPFQLDVRERRLSRGCEVIPLRLKVFDTLRVLVENAGRLVTKQELLDAVWPETSVEENNLNHNVSVLRKALGDRATGEHYIETVPRVGYRFVASVEGPIAQATTDSRSPGPGVTSIAVLPFADMSSSRDQDYLCEGVAEEIIDALTHVTGLRVAARSASFQFRGPAVDVGAAGRQLGVAALLEGSVRKTDQRLRITVQLVDVADGYRRWSQRFDRPLDDVFAIQDEIAEAVVASLRSGNLSESERAALRRPHTTSEAYEYYLRGRQYLPRMSHPDLERSRAMFARAIEMDSGYGPAWAGLATVHATLYEWFGASDHDLEAAGRVSRRALELSPGLAEAHTARGFALSLSRRYDEAEREFDEAIGINPNSFDAYYYFARSSFARGDVERSAALFHSAAEVRQEDFQSPFLLAQSLRMLGQFEQARAANHDGVQRAERVLALNPVDVRALSLGSLALFVDGQTDRAMNWSRESLELYPDDMSTLVCATCLRAQNGEKEEAIATFERLVTLGWGKRDWVEHDPDYDSLRDDLRFQRLLARLK